MWKALEEVARVHKYGDDHYGQGNWRKGQPFSEASNSMLRHWHKFFNYGEDYDEDWIDEDGNNRNGSGLLHTAHMAWNALFLLHMQTHPEYYAGCDDRMDAFGDWVNETFASSDIAKKLEAGDDI
jgi:hypothetical protein